MKIKNKYFKRKKILLLIAFAALLPMLVNFQVNNISNQVRSINDVDNLTLAISDMPPTHGLLFSGNTTTIPVTKYVDNTTSTDIGINVTNNFDVEVREDIIDLSPYTVPGYEIYAVDVNITGNTLKAEDDWVHVNSQTSSNDYKIQNQSVSDSNEMLAQQITGNWRYQIKTISTYTLITNLFGNSSSTPKIQVWDNTSGTGDVPNQEHWSADLPLSQSPVTWINTSCDVIINASAPSNRSWYIVINGTDWANGVPNSMEWLSWMYGSGTGLRYKRWGSAWFPAPNSFNLLFKRLYLADASNNSRLLNSNEVNLAVNGTFFNSSGQASVIGTNITALNITSNVTSVSGNVSLKLYYKSHLDDAVYTYYSLASNSTVNWTITSNGNVSFPQNTNNWSLQVSKGAGWSVLGVYSGTDLVSANSSTLNYTHYQVNGNDILIGNIAQNLTWQVRCDSMNQIDEIKSLIGGAIVTSVNVSDVVDFNVTFNSPQSAGNLSLGIYYPSTENDSLAFLTSNSSFGGSVTEVVLPESFNITENVLGKYRIQARWNTSTEVGFKEAIITVFGNMNFSSLSLTQFGIPLNFSSGNYQCYRGDNVTMNFSISDLFNGSIIPGLNHEITMNSSTISQGVLASTNISRELNLSSSSVGLYIVHLNFMRIYYNNVSLTINLNLTLHPVDVAIQLMQPDYSYFNTSLNLVLYYGKNATLQVNLSNIIFEPIAALDVLNASLNGVNITSSISAAAGTYNISLPVSSLNVGTYAFSVVMLKDGYVISIPITSIQILPVPVSLTILNLTQKGASLEYKSATGVWEGKLLLDLEIVVSIVNGITNESVSSGSLFMYYYINDDLIFSANASDAGDGTVDGIYTIVLPKKEEINEFGKIKLVWISNTSNYLSTSIDDPNSEIDIFFTTLVESINWSQAIIIISLIAALFVTIAVVQEKVVKPRRLEFKNKLARISSAFEDAANIQHVLIIHKNSGTCLFFKSYDQKVIDPDLISGFLSAVQSFGAELSGSRALEELKYGDYQIVLGEGDYVRIALVLASKASPILKSLVPEFISKFESIHADSLKKWRGDLTPFRSAIQLINEVFDTAIILPHKRTDLPIKPRSNLAKKILDIVEDITREREYFFIATLLSEAVKRTKRPYNEIVAAIQELREDEILTSIDIEVLEKQQQISQQELNQIQQRVYEITYLTPEEKAKLIQDLSKMRPEERQATLSSLMMMGQLQGTTGASAQAPPQGIESRERISVDTSSISSKKDAQNYIKDCDKKAKACLKNYQYQDALTYYGAAEIVANDWGLNKEVQDIMHKKIEINKKELQYNQAVLLSEARTAEKQGEYNVASQKYMEAADISSNLFKLGITSEDKKMREYTKNAEKLKKLASGS
ncbi:MAG: hypothetical protein ACTSVI_08880 [Promethearchaeota archaeon]